MDSLRAQLDSLKAQGEQNSADFSELLKQFNQIKKEMEVATPEVSQAAKPQTPPNPNTAATDSQVDTHETSRRLTELEGQLSA